MIYNVENSMPNCAVINGFTGDVMLNITSIDTGSCKFTGHETPFRVLSDGSNLASFHADAHSIEVTLDSAWLMPSRFVIRPV